MDLPLSSILGYLDYAIQQEKRTICMGTLENLIPQHDCQAFKFVGFEEFKNNLFNPQLKYSKKIKNKK